MRIEVCVVGEVFDGPSRLWVLEDGSVRWAMGERAGGSVGYVHGNIAYFEANSSPRSLGPVNRIRRKHVQIAHFHTEEDEPVLTSEHRPERTYETIS